MQGEFMAQSFNSTNTHQGGNVRAPARTNHTETVVITRLAPEAYAQLCKTLLAKGQAPMPSDGIQAAYMLGMQHVLEKLREGFVIGA
jgi:hypothetical protein